MLVLEQGMTDLDGDEVPNMFDAMVPTSHLDEPLDISKSGLCTDLARPLSFLCHFVIPVFLSAT